MSSSSPERPVGTIVKVLWPNDGKTYQGVIKRIDDGQTLIYFPATHEEWFCTEKDMKTLVSIVSMPKSNRPPPNQSALLSVQVPKASRISALENVIAEILNETNESCNTKTPTSSNDIFLKAATEISALIHSKEPGLIKLTKEIKLVLQKMQSKIEAACDEDPLEVLGHGNKSDDRKTTQNIESGLSCAVCALDIMSSRLFGDVLVEETIESITKLGKHAAQHILLPIVDPCQRHLKNHRKVDTAKTSGSKGQNDDKKKAKEKSKLISSKRKKGMPAKTAAERKLAKIVIKYLSKIVERFDLILQGTLLQESFVLNLISISKYFIPVADALVHALQLSSIQLLQTIFCNYTELQEDIFLEVLELLRHIPQKGKFHRVYKLQNPPASCQLLTVLLLQLLHSSASAENDFKKSDNKVDVKNDKKEAAEISEQRTKGTDTNKQLRRFFFGSFLQKCQQKEEGAKFRVVFGNTIADLLTLLGRVDWPAAQSCLETISNLTMGYLYNNCVTQTSNPVNKPLPQFISMTVQNLGRICCRAIDEIKHIKSQPAILPSLKLDSNPHGKPGNSDEDSQCICKRGYTGTEFMLDCDDCHRWFHGLCAHHKCPSLECECVAVSPHNIPKTWYCDACVIRREATETLKQMREQADHQRQQRLFARQKKKSETQAAVPKTPKGKRQKQKRKRKHATKACLDDSSSDIENDSLEGVLSGDDLSSQDWSFEAQRTNVLRHLLLNSLGNRSDAEINLQHVQQFYLHKWQHENGEDISFLEKKSADTVTAKARLAMSDANTKNLCRAIAVDNGSMFRVGRCIKLLAQLLNSKTTSVRKVAIKALSVIAAQDPALIADDKIVQNAVVNRLQDAQISVREASVELVGKSILSVGSKRAQDAQSPLKKSRTDDHAKVALIRILDRLKDKGVSVRKRVIRILRDLLVSQPYHPRRVQICAALVKRFTCTEEESIQKTIANTFASLWFEGSWSGDEVVGSPSLQQDAIAAIYDTNSVAGRITKEIVDVIACTTNQQVGTPGRWFISLVRDLISNSFEKRTKQKKDANSPRIPRGEVITPGTPRTRTRLSTPPRKRKPLSADDLRLTCQVIVRRITSTILSIEKHEETLSNFERHKAEAFTALRVFCEVDAGLLTEQVIPLKMYLQCAEGVRSKEKMYQEAFLLKQFVPTMQKVIGGTTSDDFDRRSLDEIEADLANLILGHYDGMVVQLSIECICTVARRKNHAANILKLLNKFFKFLYKKREQDDFSDSGNIQRAVSTIGMFCSYHDFDEAKISGSLRNLMPAKPDTLVAGTILERVFEMCYHYTKSDDPRVRSQAIRGLVSIFHRVPAMILDERAQEVFKLILAEREVLPRATLLKSLRLLREAEEEKCETPDILEKLGKKVSLKDQVITTQCAEESYTFTGIQSHIMFIHQLLFSVHKGLKKEALQLHSILLRQGLVNPLKCVSALLALQGDNSADVRARARALLFEEHTRHPDAVPLRVFQGIMLCYIVQSPNCKSTVPGVSPPDSIFSDVYSNCVRDNRLRRQNFLTQCTEQFGLEVTLPNINTFEGTKKIAQIHRVSFLVFLGETLAYLSYGTEEEPLLVVYFLDRLLELSGRALVDWFQQHAPDGNRIKGVERKKLLQRANESCAMMIAMRVKKFLMRLYNFSAARCADFSPRTNTRKAAEKPITMRSRTAMLELSDIPMEHSSVDVALETIRQFAFEMGGMSESTKRLEQTKKPAEKKRKALSSPMVKSEKTTPPPKSKPNAKKPTKRRASSKQKKTSKRKKKR